LTAPERSAIDATDLIIPLGHLLIRWTAPCNALAPTHVDARQEIVMHLFRVLATAAAMVAAVAIDPAAMAANTPNQPAVLQLVRGGGGHGRAFHGGYARRGGWGYHPWDHGYVVGGYPYADGCPYPYSYPYCTWPEG
jgi:hypothetical protein